MSIQSRAIDIVWFSLAMLRDINEGENYPEDFRYLEVQMRQLRKADTGAH